MRNEKYKSADEKAAASSQNREVQNSAHNRSEKKLSAKEIKDALRIGVPSNSPTEGDYIFQL